MSHMRHYIEQKISKDPRILEANLEVQFCELIFEPVLLLRDRFIDQPGSPATPNLVVIDGLDECGDEAAQLRILSMIRSAYRQTPHFPLRFLICSRRESWLRESFEDEPLLHLSKSIVLDDSLAAQDDIRRYYQHHFDEIASCRKRNQVQFPTLWPSEADLEALVERTCGQFIFAATVIKFIKDMFKHPIEQLHIIIKRIPPCRPGASPYEQLDILYDYILSANPDYDEVCLILAVILVLPTQSMRTPVCIEWLLGLPAGKVAATLRGMHSVLHIQGPSDGIRIFHTSFRDHLVDQTSPNKPYHEETRPFFTEWVALCTSISEPTRDFLDDLWHVDLTSSYLAILLDDNSIWWDDAFKELVLWVHEHHDPDISQNKDENQDGDRGATGESTCLKASGYLSYNKGQYAVSEVYGHGTDKGDGNALVERLTHKLLYHPRCFHLECPSGVSSAHNKVVHWFINRATGCTWTTRLDGQRPGNLNDVRLTDCRCDSSGGKKSRDPGHLAYQKACMQLFKAFVTRFETLSQSGAEDISTISELEGIFLNVVQSFLLRHCRLRMELLSLCQTFFGLAKGCLVLRVNYLDGEEGRKIIPEWIETFPDRFAQDGEALREQILSLPWLRWARNHEALLET
ncbi:hypothetical protein PQX77_019105 [Marasmius sp. AFHP31]|nr:hypothetical protein PQX77_019105 [Marasmius sp. AFHP31]